MAKNDDMNGLMRKLRIAAFLMGLVVVIASLALEGKW